jgi:CheY-like chemotaxis protein
VKILLIDDEPFVLKLLARQLANLGFTEATLCERAHDALNALISEGHAFELVFCDLQMPQMDGVEFVRQLMRIGYAGGLVLVSGEDESRRSGFCGQAFRQGNPAWQSAQVPQLRITQLDHSPIV